MDRFDLVILLAVIFYALTCPFTKVEESFQVQAIHDFLVHGENLAAYDHHVFPGAVPRSFIGPLLVAIPLFVFHRFIWVFWTIIFPSLSSLVGPFLVPNVGDSTALDSFCGALGSVWDAESFLGTRVLFFSLPPPPVPVATLFPRLTAYVANLGLVESTVNPSFARSLVSSVASSTRTTLAPALSLAISWPSPATSPLPSSLPVCEHLPSLPATRGDSLWLLVSLRLILALIFVVAWSRLRAAVASRYDCAFSGLPVTGCHRPRWFMRPSFYLALIPLTLFHMLYYCSRPLANTFALVVTTLAYAAAVSGRPGAVVALLAVATIVFRCDTFPLAAPWLGYGVVRHWMSPAIGFVRGKADFTLSQPLVRTLLYGVAASAISVAATVSIDSLLWGYHVWPELSVFLLNVVDNGSVAWGVYPWHWFVSSALPRLLMGWGGFVMLSLVPASAVTAKAESIVKSLTCTRSGSDEKVENEDQAENREQERANAAVSEAHAAVVSDSYALLVPVAIFVALYSLVPHKELRFILPCVPALYIAASLGAASAAQALSCAVAVARPCCRPLVVLVSVVTGAGIAMGAAIAATVAGWAASVGNYPGGHALVAVNDALTAVADASSGIAVVHLSNLACTTGASRFGQLRAPLVPSAPAAASTDAARSLAQSWVSAEVGAGAGAAVYDKTEHLVAAELSMIHMRADWGSGKVQWVVAEEEHGKIPGFSAPLPAVSDNRSNILSRTPPSSVISAFDRIVLTKPVARLSEPCTGTHLVHVGEGQAQVCVRSKGWVLRQPVEIKSKDVLFIHQRDVDHVPAQ